jgi:hypothetical protein
MASRDGLSVRIFHSLKDAASRLTPLRAWQYGSTLIAVALAFYLFLIPGVLLIKDICDPGIRGPKTPDLAWRLHRDLTPRIELWAQRRVQTGKAAHLQLHDVPSTEWPMFSCVFYLLATESLQRAWEEGQCPGARPPPREYARGAIEAATALVLDPVHHTWVKTHWGRNYLHTENVFFRSLIIAALTSREKLIGDGRHLDLLRDQADSLAADLDASPHGVLDDYPGECYPIDVLAATAFIRRADEVLKTDHSRFVEREIRAFDGKMLDARGLIPYSVDPVSGEQYQPSRGVGNSWSLIFAPLLWPDRAERWYKAYDRFFWQERFLAAGFREFPKDLPGYEWTYDVDAGPIIAGFSPAANAFGVAAARVNGRFDHAFTLSTQVLGACWPLPCGGLLGPRFLSNAVHAPYLGETAVLFFFTRLPAPGMNIRTGGHLPGLAWVAFAFFFGLGILEVLAAVGRQRGWRRDEDRSVVPFKRIQFVLWLLLILAFPVLMGLHYAAVALLALLFAQLLPRSVVRKPRLGD